MIVKIDTNLVLEKMEELCTSILNQEAYKELRQMIDDFASDQQAIEQYERFIAKHQSLEQKQQHNMDFTEEEADEYEREERALYENPVIRRFIYAQREFGNLHQLISQFFTKTIEQNRLPKPGELKKGSCGCGGSCGSGH